MGSGAIALSLPFSCILGLLASMTATTMGRQACNSSFVHYFFCIYQSSVMLTFIYVPSEKKICLGLCNHSVCIGGSLSTSTLFIGKTCSADIK